jgi:hypothetical protein
MDLFTPSWIEASGETNVGLCVDHHLFCRSPYHFSTFHDLHDICISTHQHFGKAGCALGNVIEAIYALPRLARIVSPIYKLLLRSLPSVNQGVLDRHDSASQAL